MRAKDFGPGMRLNGLKRSGSRSRYLKVKAIAMSSAIEIGKEAILEKAPMGAVLVTLRAWNEMERLVGGMLL